jgi:DNA-binding transcriptional ArsR family regulator
MEQLLWYLLAGTRGGLNRIRILEALRERPFNAHQLAEKLGLDYRTIRHHLDLLLKNSILARPAGDAYGTVYFLSGLMQARLEVLDRIKAKVVGEAAAILNKDDNPKEG